MTPTRLSADEIQALHERALAGESLVSLARERSMFTSNLSQLLKRRFGYQVPADRLRGFKPVSIIMPSDPATLGYIAGLIDGEGSIMVRHLRTQAAVTIRIGMTDEPVIRWLSSVIGGSVTRHDPDPPRKSVWTWVVFRQADAELLLRTIEPLLRVKKARAQEAITELVKRRIIGEISTSA